MKILVINTGSSSIKFSLFDIEKMEPIAHGLVERIADKNSRIIIHSDRNEYHHEAEISIPSHKEGMQQIAELLTSEKANIISSKSEINGIGHRVVHGGEKFHEPVIINDEVIEAVREHIPLAPLHNPANLIGIEESARIFPGIPMVGVFDTSFHQSIPDYAYHYAIPYEFYEKYKVRRYGFHGTSHAYVSNEAIRFMGLPEKEGNFITIHLGNGCSISAIKNGKSIDTSMGMTPLEGLIMGTRSGDLDPALHFYLAKEAGLNMDDLDKVFNKESGLKGITGSNDMRDISQMNDSGDKMAKLALKMYSYRVKKYIGAYLSVIGPLDALIFTAGIGENSALIRKMSLEGLEHLGIILDEKKNSESTKGARDIATEQSPIKILVIPTNEELQIALESKKMLKKPN